MHVTTALIGYSIGVTTALIGYSIRVTTALIGYSMGVITDLIGYCMGVTTALATVWVLVQRISISNNILFNNGCVINLACTVLRTLRLRIFYTCRFCLLFMWGTHDLL